MRDRDCACDFAIFGDDVGVEGHVEILHVLGRVGSI
jgi:hypothetical protein